jgi:ATP-dependent Clp protease adaptor protein ClpS
MSEQLPDIIEQVQQDDQEQTEEPPLFRVLLHNDDYTPKDLVVEILVVLFHKERAAAMELMWRIHKGAAGVAGVYPHEIAETKVLAVTTVARESGFPLKATMEPDV